MAAEDRVSVGSQIMPDLQMSDGSFLLVVEKKGSMLGFCGIWDRVCLVRNIMQPACPTIHSLRRLRSQSSQYFKIYHHAISNVRISVNNSLEHCLKRRKETCLLRIYLSWFDNSISSRPLYDVPRSHSCMPRTLGFVWRSDRPDAETSMWQQETNTRDRRPWPQRDSNPQSLQASGGKTTP